MKLTRNSQKKWILDDPDYGHFEFDSIVEARKKMDQINIYKLKDMAGNTSCQICGSEFNKCECENYF